jgi:hypothetical protein
VAKPVDTRALVEVVGRIIGFPEAPADEVVEDESLSLSDLVDEEEPKTNELSAGDIPPEEIQVDETVHGDPELDMLDAAFDDISEPPKPPISSEEEVLPLETVAGDSAENALGDLGDEELQVDAPPAPPIDASLDETIDPDFGVEKTVIGMPEDVAPTRPPPPPRRGAPPPPTSSRSCPRPSSAPTRPRARPVSWTPS